MLSIYIFGVTARTTERYCVLNISISQDIIKNLLQYDIVFETSLRITEYSQLS